MMNFITNHLEKHIIDEGMISPKMYDPYKMQDKVSIAIFDKNEEGYTRKRFLITVEDLKAPANIELHPEVFSDELINFLKDFKELLQDESNGSSVHITERYSQKYIDKLIQKIKNQ